MFVIAVPVLSAATMIALDSDVVLVEKISPLLSIVVLSAPSPASPRIVFPLDEITPPLLLIIDAPSELLTLIDRRFSRHLPIQPNYRGRQVDAINDEKVLVNWKESSGEDAVYLIKN